MSNLEKEEKKNKIIVYIYIINSIDCSFEMNTKRKNKDTIDLVTMNTKEKAKIRRECYHPFSRVYTYTHSD